MRKNYSFYFKSASLLIVLLNCLNAFVFGQSATLVCNSPGIQVSVPSNCVAELTADMLLEGNFDNTITYFIKLKQGNRVVEFGPADDALEVDGIDPNGLAYTYINRTFNAQIFAGDPASNPGVNSCWLTILFEDKLAPVFDIGNPSTHTLSCTDDLSCVPIPSATDNCGTATVVPTGEVYSQSNICAGITITRSFIAYDAQGNVSAPFSDIITITQSPVVFPRNIEWTCAQYASYPSITAASPRSSCVFDTFDDDGDMVIENADDDDDDPTTLYDQEDDIITVGLIVGADDGAPTCGTSAIENDSANGFGCDEALCNLTVAAGGMGISCALPLVAGLEDDDVLEITGSGIPNVAATNGACMYHVTYTDQQLSTCNGAAGVLKIAREWRVLNWCTNEVLIRTQLIKVTDNTPPVLTVNSEIEINANVAGAGHSSCGSSGLLPVPVLSDDCSGIDLTSLQVSTPVGQGIPVIVQGQVIGFRIPAPYLQLGGPYTVTYSVSDACGNITTVTSEVTVIDNTPPVGICKEITNLSLTTTPTSSILAASLDDRSYDQCSPVYFKIIRMNELIASPIAHAGESVTCDEANSEDPLELNSSVFFDDEAYFCCEDILTNNNMVIVRIYDVDPGNGAVLPERHLPGGDLFERYNDCMVEIEVEDKLAPVKTLAAQDQTILCTDQGLINQYIDPDNIEFQAPVFEDNCDFTVNLTISDNRPSCESGEIIREFQAVDVNNNFSVICRQTITVLPVNDYVIQWQDDFSGPNFNISAILADTLTQSAITNNGCGTFAINHEDVTFTDPSDPCVFKVLRTTDVIVWCEWDGNSDAVCIENPTNTSTGVTLGVSYDQLGNSIVTINGQVDASLTSIGRWKYIQVFEFNSDPGDYVLTIDDFNNCSTNSTLTTANPAMLACGGPVRTEFTVTDNCGTPSTFFQYFVVTNFVDANNNGVFDSGEGDSYEGQVDEDPFGSASFFPDGSIVLEGTYPPGELIFFIDLGNVGGGYQAYHFIATVCPSSVTPDEISISSHTTCVSMPPATAPSNPFNVQCGGAVNINFTTQEGCPSSVAPLAVDYYVVTEFVDNDGSGDFTPGDNGYSFQNFPSGDSDPYGQLVGNTVVGTYPEGIVLFVFSYGSSGEVAYPVAVANCFSVAGSINNLTGINCDDPTLTQNPNPIGTTDCLGAIQVEFTTASTCSTSDLPTYFVVTDFVDVNGNGIYDAGDTGDTDGVSDPYGVLAQTAAPAGYQITGNYPIGSVAFVISFGGDTQTQVVEAKSCFDANLVTFTDSEACQNIGLIGNRAKSDCGGVFAIFAQRNCNPPITSIDYTYYENVDVNFDGIISAQELSNATPVTTNFIFFDQASGRLVGTADQLDIVVEITALNGQSLAQPILFNYNFTNSDCIRPVPQISSPISKCFDANGMVTFEVSDINFGSFDGCGGPVTLEISDLIVNSFDPSDCSADYVNGGNTSTSSLTLNINDHFYECPVNPDPNATKTYIGSLRWRLSDNAVPPNTIGGTIEIEALSGGNCRSVRGNIKSTRDQPIQQTQVQVSGDYFNSYLTLGDGFYNFENIPSGSEVTIAPRKTDDAGNGLTTLDIYEIGQHLLGVQEFDNPHSLLAADANNSGFISAYDMTLIRRVILDRDPVFTHQDSWRFIDANHTFSNPLNPWSSSIPETIVITDLQSDMRDLDFVGVKIGDVNHSARANLMQPLQARTIVGDFALVAEDQLLSTDQVHRVSFTASDLNAFAYQGTLTWNPNLVEVLRIEAGSHPIDGFGTHLLKEGKLTLSHNGSLEGELFALEVKALQAGFRLSELFTISSSSTAAEAYSADGYLEMKLKFGNSVIGLENSLEQNRPNPFNGNTIIGFTLAKAGVVRLTVTDAAGRIVWQTLSEYPQGHSQVSISSQELKASGVLRYSISSGEFSATKTMVVIN